MKLTIINQQWPTSVDQWAALGDISLEGAKNWIEVMQGHEDLSVLYARSAQLTLQSTSYMLPEDVSMTELDYEDKESVETWTYVFLGTQEELDHLVDKLTIVSLRRELAIMGPS